MFTIHLASSANCNMVVPHNHGDFHGEMGKPLFSAHEVMGSNPLVHKCNVSGVFEDHRLSYGDPVLNDALNRACCPLIVPRMMLLAESLLAFGDPALNNALDRELAALWRYCPERCSYQRACCPMEIVP